MLSPLAQSTKYWIEGKMAGADIDKKGNAKGRSNKTHAPQWDRLAQWDTDCNRVYMVALIASPTWSVHLLGDGTNLLDGMDADSKYSST